MDRLRRGIFTLLHSLQRWNLFNTYSTDKIKIRQEILSTRVYVILLSTIMTIFFIYTAQKELYHSGQVSNPSIDTYQRLLEAYPDTLACPCSQLSIPYSTFVTLTHVVHPVCSSYLVSDQWLRSLYHDDASSYFAHDIRAVGNAQFQLLRTLCKSSAQAIDNAFNVTFASVTFTSGRGMVMNSEAVHVQVGAFIQNFITNIASDQQNRRSLAATFFQQNFLVSGLKTSFLPYIDSTSKLNIRRMSYEQFEFVSNILLISTCHCDTTYECWDPVAIFGEKYYDMDYPDVMTVMTFFPDHLIYVHGFKTGCLPLNSLLQSTLECYYQESCFHLLISNLSIVDTPSNVLNISDLKRSVPTSLISTLGDQLMVEDWSTQINYSRYYTSCRVLSCSYSYTKRLNSLYVIATLVGVFGGLTTILRFLCPRAIHGFYQVQKYLYRKRTRRTTVSLESGKSKDLVKRETRNRLLNSFRSSLIVFLTHKFHHFLFSSCFKKNFYWLAF